MSAVIASGAVLFHHVDLARAAMWIAAIAGRDSFTDSADHGSRPPASLPQHAARFQTSLGHVDGRLDSQRVRGVRRSRFDRARTARASEFSRAHSINFCASPLAIFIFASAIFGTLLATYTGVLIGATAIPAWFLHRTLLPIHFGTAGLGSAAGLLELLGHRIPALNFLGFYAAGD